MVEKIAGPVKIEYSVDSILVYYDRNIMRVFQTIRVVPITYLRDKRILSRFNKITISFPESNIVVSKQDSLITFYQHVPFDQWVTDIKLGDKQLRDIVRYIEEKVGGRTTGYIEVESTIEGRVLIMSSGPLRILFLFIERETPVSITYKGPCRVQVVIW